MLYDAEKPWGEMRARAKAAEVNLDLGAGPISDCLHSSLDL